MVAKTDLYETGAGIVVDTAKPEIEDNIVRPGKDILSNLFKNTIIGTDGTDTLRGTEGKDIIKGLKDKDWLYGEDGNDSLYGGGTNVVYEAISDRGSKNTGHDHLYGGSGDDGLNGGDGADELTGGTGADRFVFNLVEDSNGSERDVIVDFNREEGDKIDLRAIDAHKGWWKPGDQKFEVKQLSYSDGILTANVFSSSGELQVELTGAPALDLATDIIY